MKHDLWLKSTEIEIWKNGCVESLHSVFLSVNSHSLSSLSLHSFIKPLLS